MSEAIHPSTTEATARDAMPSPTLVYGGMGAGPAFTGRNPGEVPTPTVMAVNVNPQRRALDVATVLAEPLRESTGKTWWESTQGRVGTRLISRGVFGSIAYALASMAVERAMQRYSPHKAIDDSEHYENANRPYHKFIRGCAKLLDKTVGAGMTSLFGANAAVFRNTRHFGRTDGPDRLGPDGKTMFRLAPEVMGRSLGHEYVEVVFNFAAASIGDSTARNLAGLIDPHKKVSWLQDGKFDVKKFAISQGKAAWKTLSYFAGEDFVAGLPYIYLMKAQRTIMDKISPGFKYVFDYGNTDAYKVDKAGNITGSFYWENIADYQLRFSNYNVLTLMFRETYNSVGDRLNAWTKGEDKLKISFPDSVGDAVRNTGKFFKDAARYIVHSTIKGYVMMTLTVPFFAFFRLPQAKRGPFGAMAINPEFGPVMINSNHLVSEVGAALELLPKYRTVRPLVPDFRSRMRTDDNLTDGKDFFTPGANGFEKVPGKELGLSFFQSGKNPAAPISVPNNPYYQEHPGGAALFNTADPYEISRQRLGAGKFSLTNFFNKAGEKSNNWGRGLYASLSDILYGFRNGNRNAGISAPEAEQDLKSATTAGVNAVLPYTAYFMAKTEFGQRDTAEMDRQIDKVQDGIAHLDGKMLVDGVKGIAKEFVKPSKNTGAGSIFGHDNADTTGVTPWSKRVDAPGMAQTSHLERIAATTGVPLAVKPKQSAENWRDRQTESVSATNPTLS